MAKKKKRVVPAKKVAPSNNTTFVKPSKVAPFVKPTKAAPFVKPNEKSFSDLPYPYYKHIKTPEQLKMSEDGTISALSNNINGLIGYVELLISGSGKASATGKPLGDRYFINTGSKCLDKKTKSEVDRHIYIDNVPGGIDLGFIKSGMGQNFKETRGLIPGAMGNLQVLNPARLMNAFGDLTKGSFPECQQITMQTIDDNNITGIEKHYVTLTDIDYIDKKLYSTHNTSNGSKETFETMKISSDPMDQLYYISLAGLGIYLIYKLTNR